MRNQRVVLLVVLVLALGTMSCGLNLDRLRSLTGRDVSPTAQATEATLPQEQSPEAEVTEVPTEEPPPASPVPTQSAVEDFEETELDLGTSMSGLENLNSYRAEFRFDWNGDRGDQPVVGFMQMSSAFVREPPAQELHFEGQGFQPGDDQSLGKVSFIQVGDTAWFYEGESDTWSQVPAGSLNFSQGLFFRPEDLLKNFDISKARRSLLPTIMNGVECYVHTFNEKDFDLTDLPQGSDVMRAEGKVCVAVDGGYVVNLVIDADFRYTDTQQVFDEGNIRMTYDISDINQPITIEPPAEAEAQAGGRDDIPMLPDADVEFASAEFISYRTGSSVEDVASFYQNEMPKYEWAAEVGNLVMADTAFLNYNKGAESASIVIGADDNGSNVVISITQ